MLFAQGIGRCLGADPPASEPRPDPPQPPEATASLPDEVIILNSAADIGEFLKKIKQPDLIILKPGSGGGGQERAGAIVSGSGTTHVINSIKIRGRAANELVDVEIELEIGLLVRGPEWVPIGLEHQMIASAREGDRELELKAGAHDDWRVRLEGQGTHTLRVDFKSPVQADPERKRLQLVIPAAPSTYLDVEIPRAVADDVRLEGGEWIGKSTLAAGRGTRIKGYVTPRSRLLLEWSNEGDPGSQVAVLLAAQAEIEIDADPDKVTTRSSWVIRCVRGIARSLELRLDEKDIVSHLELDDQSIIARIERNLLTVPLPEPLRPGASRRLLLHTHRTFPPSAARTFEFTGFPLSNAGEQSGAIAITQAPNLWVDVRSARGVRRIDPRYLPTALRLRPRTSMAYQFLDLPYELDLGIEASPPLYRSETRTRLSLDAGVVENQTTVEIHRVRGRLYEIDVAIPKGLELTSIGPPDLVESSNLLGKDATSGGDTKAALAGQVLRINLTNLGRDQKSFSLNIVGRQRIGSSDEVSLGLFSVIGCISTGNVYQLFTARDLSFELGAPEAGTGGTSFPVFRRQPIDERRFGNAAWGGRAPALVLESNYNPTSLKGRLVRHPLEVVHGTRLTARASRQKVDVRQETSVQVRYGSLESLVVQVPFQENVSWDVQAKEAVRREDLGPVMGEPSRRRYRLNIDPPITDRSSLLFRYQIPLGQPSGESGEVSTSIPWILFEEGIPRPTTVELTSEPGVKTAVRDPAWAEADDAQTHRPSSDDASRRYRQIARDPQRKGFTLSSRTLDQVPMPPLVASRVLLRTTLGADGDTRTHAWYLIESHPSYLSFSLPEHASWIRARVDGRGTEQLEQEPASASYRLGLPAGSQSGTVLVEIEYQLKAGMNDGYLAPRLLQGAVAMETLWEVEVPWNLAVIGVPAGWTDENRWYWDRYVWKRRPWKSLSNLVGWVAASTAQSANLGGGGDEERGDAHSYLFGKAGEPVPLRPWIASRAWIVGVGSGAVLALGFFVMFCRVPFRLVWVAAAVFCLLGIATIHPSTLLLMVQSSVSGAVLALLGLAIQRVVERTRGGTSATVGSGSTSSSSGRVIAPSGSAGVGSDDSTAIRVRVPSTMDHVAAPLIVRTEQPSALSSSSEPAG